MSNEKKFTQADVDRMSEKRNKSVNRKISEVQEKISVLREQQEADGVLLSERDELQDGLAKLHADQSELNELQEQINRQNERAEFFKQQNEVDKRRVILARAARGTNAIDLDQLEAFTAEVPTDELIDHVAGMREDKKYANVFAPTNLPGIGLRNEPSPGPSLKNASVHRVKDMSQEEFIEARKAGAFEDQLGPLKEY